MIQLRQYQSELIKNIQLSFSKGNKRVLACSPTGSGKTVVFCELSKKTASKGNKVLILTNRIELLSQAGGSLDKVGIKPFLITAGAKYVSKDTNVYVAMAQTLKNRLEDVYWIEFLKSISMIIIDECHIQDFNFVFESELLSNKYIIGFTATPRRSGKQRQFGIDYQDIIETISVKELIEMGYLVDADYYGCSMPDLSNVEYDRMKGDYQEKSLFQAFNSPKLYAGVVRNWLKICANTKTLVFCCNIEHAIRTCKEFNNNGIAAKFLVSGVSKPKYPSKITDGSIAIYNEKMELYELYCNAFILWSGDRDLIVKEFERGDFDVLINASILTTGFDCPSIETVVINRATMSIPLWLQMLGRGSRIYNGKTHFNILDFGDNQTRLGTYSQDRQWSLWHEESKGGGIAPIKRCGFDSKDKPIYAANNPLRSDMFNKRKLDGCGVYIHAGLTICPFCGFKYPEKESKEVDLENIYFDQTALEFKKTKPISQMNDSELSEYQQAKGHNIAWLWRQIYMRGSYRLGFEGGIQRIDNQDWTEKNKESAKKYCQRFA